MKQVAAVLLALMAGPALAQNCVVPDGWTAMTPTEATDIVVALRGTDSPAPVSQPIAFQISVCGLDAPQLTIVDAIMPAHQHGMNYVPEISSLSDQIFSVSGMLLHMPGLWRLDVGVKTDDGVAHFELDVTAR